MRRERRGRNTWKFLQLRPDSAPHVRGAESAKQGRCSTKCPLRLIIFQLQKVRGEEKLLTEARQKKKKSYFGGTKLRITSNFSETMPARRERREI